MSRVCHMVSKRQNRCWSLRCWLRYGSRVACDGSSKQNLIVKCAREPVDTRSTQVIHITQVSQLNLKISWTSIT